MQHGYVFEVDPTGRRTEAVPYRTMGRMVHEAVVIDPATGIPYETEDNGRGLVSASFRTTLADLRAR